ncbi:hypothetical protein BH23ACT2_BH23ACT2_13020 [soil metagenome]
MVVPTTDPTITTMSTTFRPEAGSVSRRAKSAWVTETSTRDGEAVTTQLCSGGAAACDQREHFDA